MSEQEDSGNAPSLDPNLLLGSLVDRLEAGIDEVRSTAVAQPLFAVEAVLTATLHEMIPEAKFTGHRHQKLVSADIKLAGSVPRLCDHSRRRGRWLRRRHLRDAFDVCEEPGR